MLTCPALLAYISDHPAGNHASLSLKDLTTVPRGVITAGMFLSTMIIGCLGTLFPLSN
jgi:hypothetical protein